MTEPTPRIHATADEIVTAIKVKLGEINLEKNIPTAALLGAIEVLKVEVATDHSRTYREIMERHLAAEHGAPAANDTTSGA